MSRKIYNRLSFMEVSWLDESTLPGRGVSLTHRMGACTLADGCSSVSHGRPYVQASPPETPHDPA
jgi:hypothetical protein